MSPRIDLTVNSIGKLVSHTRKQISHYTIKLLTILVAYDPSNLLLYVSISQVFRIWVLPFYAAPVDLVTVIRLQHNESDGKYYIAGQNDLYQTDEWVKFIPLVPGVSLLVRTLQLMATVFCVLATYVFWPVTLMEAYLAPQIHPRGGEEEMEKTDRIEQNEKRTVNTIRIMEPKEKGPWRG